MNVINYIKYVVRTISMAKFYKPKKQGVFLDNFYKREM